MSSAVYQQPWRKTQGRPTTNRFANGLQDSLPSPKSQNPQPHTFERGRSLMLFSREGCKDRGLPRPRNMCSEIFNQTHPALVLEEYPESVRVVLISTFKNASFSGKTRMVRKQHIPISPAPPHPDYHDQLQLKVGMMHKDDSYIKAHETWYLPKHYFTGNFDKATGQQIVFTPSSVDYVTSLAKEFDIYRIWPESDRECTHTEHRDFRPRRRIRGFQTLEPCPRPDPPRSSPSNFNGFPTMKPNNQRRSRSPEQPRRPPLAENPNPGQRRPPKSRRA